MADNEINKIQKLYMAAEGSALIDKWKYYRGDKSVIPVYSRTAASPMKAKSHTNEHVDFFGDIIDIKSGYMGEAIDVIYTGENKAAEDELRRLDIGAQLKTTNSQTIEYSSVEGISHRLVYTLDGEFKMKNLHGWQVIYDWDDDYYNPNLAYYFYSTTELGASTSTNYCNVYDKTNVYYYKQQTKKSTYEKESQYGGNYVIYQDEQPHNFNRVPIIPFKNTSNDEGNCDQAIQLMDVYDEIISDTSGEIKAARLAYLKIFGDIMTGEDSNGDPIPIPRYLEQFGAMLFPVGAEGKPLGDAEFLEKKLDDTAIVNMLDRHRQHIYEVSGSIDLKELTAAERVFSIKASMRRLENNAMTSENYFKLGMQQIIKLWLYFLSEYKKSITLDEIDFKITVGRVFPQDEQARAETFSKLVGVLSVEDALRLSGYGEEEILDIADRAGEQI